MPNDYDKIIKENLEAVLLPLVQKLLQIEPKKMEEMPDDLQVTLERKPDLLKKVTGVAGDVFILHIEFQTIDDPLMQYRMLEYHAILMRKYLLPVRQLVLFLGKGTSHMPDEIIADGLHFHYTLKNIQDYHFSALLTSEIPEEIILAILGDFGNEEPVRVVRKILERLQKLSANKLKLQRYIRQLAVLSNLRNLRDETINQLKEMSFTYDITKDTLYKEGVEKGLEKGVEKGIEKNKQEVVLRMLKSGALSVAQIAEFTDVPEKQVLQLQKKLAKKKK